MRTSGTSRSFYRKGCSVPVVAALAAAAGIASAQGPSKNWTTFIKGKDFSAWRQPIGEWTNAGEVTLNPENSGQLSWKPGTGMVVNGPKGRTRHLFTKMEHADVEAHVEFMVSKGSNSGVYFMGRYEIQILDSWDSEKNRPKENPTAGDCGGIYERWKDNKGYEGIPPRVNAAKKPGEWQTFDVQFRAPRFDASGKKTSNAKFIKVVHNGRVVHENKEVTGPTRAAAFNDEKPTGPLMLQGDHGPVAYANIRIRALPSKPASPLDEAFDRLPAYDFGDSGKDLQAIDEEIRKADVAQKKELESRLVAVLASPAATFAAKQFVCRKLRTIGTDQSIPALAKLLMDEKLSHMARYALQEMSSDEVDAAFRGGLKNLSGKPKVGLIGSIAARGDRRAVSQLAGLISDSDAAVAGAALAALGKIGGSQAADALAKAKVSGSLETVRADAYLLCADKMLAGGNASAAKAIYRKMLGKGNAPEIRIAALRGIAKTKDRAAIDEVKKAAESEKPALRTAAERTLKTLEE